MTPPPTALTLEEQEIINDMGLGAIMTASEREAIRIIIRRLDALLSRDGWVNLADPTVCHGGHAACVHVVEEVGKLTAQIAFQEAELLKGAAAWEKLAEERNALARALEDLEYLTRAGNSPTDLGVVHGRAVLALARASQARRIVGTTTDDG